MKRVCPYCHRPLRWEYSNTCYDLGRPWCLAHGRVRLWHVVKNRMVLAVGHLTRHGRLLKTPLPNRKVSLSNPRWLGHSRSPARRWRKVLAQPLQGSLRGMVRRWNTS